MVRHYELDGRLREGIVFKSYGYGKGDAQAIIEDYGPFVRRTLKSVESSVAPHPGPVSKKFRKGWACAVTGVDGADAHITIRALAWESPRRKRVYVMVVRTDAGAEPGPELRAFLESLRE